MILDEQGSYNKDYQGTWLVWIWIFVVFYHDDVIRDSSKLKFWETRNDYEHEIGRRIGVLRICNRKP
jgi:hypothetical protein